MGVREAGVSGQYKWRSRSYNPRPSRGCAVRGPPSQQSIGCRCPTMKIALTLLFALSGIGFAAQAQDTTGDAARGAKINASCTGCPA